MATPSEKLKEKLISSTIKKLTVMNPRLTKLLSKLLELCVEGDFDNFREKFNVSSKDKLILIVSKISLKEPAGQTLTLLRIAIRVIGKDDRFFKFLLDILTELKSNGKVNEEIIDQLFTNIEDGVDNLSLLTVVGDFVWVKAVIDLGVDPKNSIALFRTSTSVKDDQKMIAAERVINKEGRRKILELFLTKGVTPRTITVSHSESTLLLRIAQNNDLEALKLLIKFAKQKPDLGINFNEYSLKDEMTALKIAALYGYVEMAELLLAAGADPDLQTDYLKTTLEHHGIPAQGLTEYTFFQRDNETFRGTNYGLFTPLMLAAERGHVDLIPLLITKANINKQNREGKTALHWGIEHLEVVRLLLNAGASVDITDKDGNTPIVELITTENDGLEGINETVSLLAEKMDVSGCYAYFEGEHTLVVLAASLGKLDILKILISSMCKHKKELDRKQIQVCLIRGIDNKHPNIVKFILDKYPSIIQDRIDDLSGKFNCSFLEITIASWVIHLKNENQLNSDDIGKLLSILKMILEATLLQMKDLDRKVRQDLEFDIVLFAAKNGALPLVKFFVESGVDVTQNVLGKSAFGNYIAKDDLSGPVPLPILHGVKDLATMQWLIEHFKTNNTHEFQAWQKRKFPCDRTHRLEVYHANQAVLCVFYLAPFDVFDCLIQKGGAPFDIFNLFYALCGLRSVDTIPDFARKLTWSLNYLFQQHCKNSGVILNSDWTLAISRLSGYLTARHENLSFKKDDLKLDLRFSVVIQRTSMEVNISSHVNSILKAMVKDLPKNSGSQFVEKQIRRILCCYVGSETSPVEGLGASQSGLKEQENFEEVLLTIRDFDKTRDSIKRLNETILDKTKSTQFNLQSSIHNTQFHGYYAKKQDMKAEHEKDNTEWQEQLSKIYKDLEEINKTPFLPPKTEDVEVWKKALDEVKTQSDKLLNCLKLLKSLQALVNDRVKMQEEQNTAFIAIIAKAEDKTDKRKKGKSKSEKPKSTAKETPSQAPISASAFGPASHASVAKSGDGDAALGKLEQYMNEFGSKLEALQLAARQYLDPLKEAAARAEQKRREARQKQKKEEFKEARDSLTVLGYAASSSMKNVGLPATLDSVADISGRLARLELSADIKQRHDLPHQEDYEKIWKTWTVVGGIAQGMEGAKGALNTLLSKVAARLRDLLFYTFFDDKAHLKFFKDRDHLLAGLFKVSNNVTKFLNQESSGSSYKTYSSISDLLTEIDPDPALLLKLFKEHQQNEIKITVEHCESQIRLGLKRLAECRNKFIETQGKCDQALLVQALGTIFALIGNFASHLRTDFVSGPEKKEAMEAFRKLNGECRNIDENLTLSTCINIGKLYRHLNKRLIKDKETRQVISREPVDKEQQWEAQLNRMIERWHQELQREPRGYLPYHRASTAAIASRPDSGSLSLSLSNPKGKP